MNSSHIKVLGIIILCVFVVLSSTFLSFLWTQVKSTVGNNEATIHLIDGEKVDVDFFRPCDGYVFTVKNELVVLYPFLQVKKIVVRK